jgi:hypothetical protein
MRILMIVAAAALLSLAVPHAASAQDEGLVRRTALAERYLRLSYGEDLRPLVAGLVEEQLAADVEMSPEERDWFRANLPVFFDRFMDSLVRDMAPRYAAVMTDEELNAAIAFFSSPVGRSLARKETALTIDMDDEIYEAAAAMVIDMDVKYCATFACSELPTVVPSGK